MRKSAKLWLKRMLWLGAMLFAAFAVWLAGYGFSDLAFSKPLQFSLKQGSSLRSASRQMQAAGVLDSPWQFELLARIFGHAGRIQAVLHPGGGRSDGHVSDGARVPCAQLRSFDDDVDI